MSVSAVDYICDRIVNSDNFELSYEKLFLTTSRNRFNDNATNPISNSEYKKLLKYSDFLSNSKSSFYRSLSLKIISSLYELYNNEPNCQLIVKSVLNKFGLFSAEENLLMIAFAYQLVSNFLVVIER
jgi:hypothetical protein